MAYTRPAITVIQQFLGLVPALAQFALPTVVVGPAYQLVTADNFGSYTGEEIAVAWPSLMTGAQVDLSTALDPTNPFPQTQMPIAVSLTNAQVQMATATNTGSGSGITFSDATSEEFESILSGDILVITETTDISVVPAQTNGASVATSGLTNRLTAGTTNQFAHVEDGDTVVVTAGTNAIAGSFTVIAWIDANNIVLSGAINDGSGASSNTAFTITGTRGATNQGSYIIKTVTDANDLILQTPLAEAEALLSYTIVRPFANIALTSDQFTAIAATLSLPADLEYIPLSLPIVAGTIKANYRALRNDLAGSIQTFNTITDLQTLFGVSQILPANPLAFGISIQLQNTTTSVNGLALDGNAVSDEVLSHQNASETIFMSDMYAIVPLTQNPAIHQVWASYVTSASEPANMKECITILNRTLVTTQNAVDESTTNTTSVQTIVNTHVTGAGVASPAGTVNDATSNVFNAVRPGDRLHVVGGTNATVGIYPILTTPTENSITVTGSVFTGTCTNLQYFIDRQDGIGSNGTDFYDHSQTFLADGVVAGDFLQVMSGEFAGSYQIAAVLSDHELTIAQVPGVVSLQTAVEYEIYSNLSLTQQAEFLAGYSQSFANRRVVMIWPDSVQTPVGTQLYYLPGFYAGCAVGALVTGLPTQQGFTNLTVSGFLGFQHSTGYFNDTQLDLIAAGGTFIFVQAGAQQPLSIRHQLTTDLSSIKFQELSVTKNVDFIAKFLRTTYAPFIGIYNIVNSTFDELRSTAQACITFLSEDTILPRIGGVIQSGTMSSLIQDPANIDGVLITFTLDIPIPLNNITITLQV